MSLINYSYIFFSNHEKYILLILIIYNLATSLRMVNEDRSIALPFDKRPPALDGSLPGDVGFDPAGFTNKLPQVRFLFIITC